MKKFAILVAALALGGCRSYQPIQSYQNQSWTIDKLFSIDGCTAYWAYQGSTDDGFKFVHCAGSNSTRTEWEENHGKSGSDFYGVDTVEL